MIKYEQGHHAIFSCFVKIACYSRVTGGRKKIKRKKRIIKDLSRFVF